MRHFDGFKKVKEDNKSTHFAHPNGSKLVVAHNKLDPKTLKQLKALPMACGGNVQRFEDGGQMEDQAPTTEPDPMPEEGIKQGLAHRGEQLQAVGHAIRSTWHDYSTDKPETSDSQQDQNMPTTEPAPTNINLGNSTVAPQPSATGAPPGMQYDPTKGLNMQLSGAQAEGQAASDFEKQKAGIAQNYGDVMQQLNYQAQQNAWNNNVETSNAIEDLKNGHIDPKAYVNNLSGGQKVSTAIGLFLGGLSAPFTHQGNPALDFLNKQIQNDISAQVQNRDNKLTVFNAMQKQYGNQQDALKMTQAFYMAKMQNDINEAAAKAGSPMALARAQQASGAIQQQLDQIHMQVGWRQAAMNGNPDADPSLFVPMLVPKEHQQKVFDEIDSAQNTAQNAPKIMQAFDHAAGNVHAMDFVPGVANADQKALHALMGPTFKDVEGTVRQAAMDNMFKNITPQVGDDKNTTATKRAALAAYLRSKSSAPTAKGYGIDLGKFKSTNFSGGTGFQKR